MSTSHKLTKTAAEVAGTAPPAKTRSNRRIAISAGGIVVLLGALDTYVVVGLLKQIMHDLQVPANEPQQITPVVTAYLLGYVAIMPLLGRASDRFGRKLVLHTCLAGFLIGSVITALAENVPLLVSGRVMQGVASGSLLPVTLALAGDLWSDHRRRPAALGMIGAAQELGSVLGPLYGIGVSALAGWRGVFWVNVPLILLTAIAVQITVPRQRSLGKAMPGIDVVGGLLLAIALSLVVGGLHSPDPQHAVLPRWGMPMLLAAAVVGAVFFVWEYKAQTKLLDPTGVRMGAFLPSLGTSLAAGAALMVTLVDVDLFAQTVLGYDDTGSVLLLLRFLMALPLGAILGGVLTSRFGERPVTACGMLIASAGYLLMSDWSVNPLATNYTLGPVSLPRLGTDLGIAGFGLGLVIAPLSAAVLRAVPPAQHGIASASVVVTRMTGMLIGIAALSAWGLHRFHSLTAHLPTPLPFNKPLAQFAREMTDYRQAVTEALLIQYREIFLITSITCVIGALLSLLITRQNRASRL